MLNEYLVGILLAIIIVVFMYITHIKDTNKELKRQKQNLQTKIVQEKVQSNIKEFQAYQKAKKEQIVKDIKKENNEKKSDINLSVGSHTYNF